VFLLALHACDGGDWERVCEAFISVKKAAGKVRAGDHDNFVVSVLGRHVVREDALQVVNVPFDSIRLVDLLSAPESFGLAL
jgi:hypothetical protein